MPLASMQVVALASLETFCQLAALAAAEAPEEGEKAMPPRTTDKPAELSHFALRGKLPASDGCLPKGQRQPLPAMRIMGGKRSRMLRRRAGRTPS